MLALFGSYHFTKNAGDDFDTPVPSSLKYFRFFVDTNLNSWFYTKKCFSFLRITINNAIIVTTVNSKPKKTHDNHERDVAKAVFQNVPNLNNINQTQFLLIRLYLFLLKNHPMYTLSICLAYWEAHQLKKLFVPCKLFEIFF